MDWTQIIFPLVGGISLTGIAGVYLRWRTYPPRLVIDKVTNNHLRLNSESRFTIKNAGTFPAWNIQPEIRDPKIKIGGMLFGGSLQRSGLNSTELRSGEVFDLPTITDLIRMPPSVIDSCEYTLVLKYDLRILKLKRTISQSWKIELRNYPDGSFAWNFTVQ